MVFSIKAAPTGRGGRKRKEGAREPNGKPSRRIVDVHARGEVPLIGWFVYFATTGGITKVGYSGAVKNRLAALGYENRATLRLTGLLAVNGEDREARDLEAEVHRELKARGYHCSGEWFDMSDNHVREFIRSMMAKGHKGRAIQAAHRPPKLNGNHSHSDPVGRKFSGPFVA